MHPLELTLLWLQLAFGASSAGLVFLAVALYLPKSNRWGNRAALAWVGSNLLVLMCLVCAVHAAYLPGGYAEILTALQREGLV
ncbi:hypothetical protein GURKE_00130 [Brevundimonas phage vB_BpoS-Gurke]|uniref:Uncharacterized protein n=1 Tax=Brevundimonas phage vB_BpoS-Gurke TaxID=2948599 RepID=A0A9E7N387_9CAUD|nr:hypothetical protein GURKE_00130 [Brevundimonas phage vB_BpoS-Gurke]